MSLLQNRSGLPSRSNSVRLCFDRHDTSNSARLDRHGLHEGLRALNKPYTETEIASIAGEEFDFYVVAGLSSARTFKAETVIEAFQGLSGGAASVSADLIKFWLTTMGEELTDEEIDIVFEAMEIGPGGVFDIGKFVELVQDLAGRLHDVEA